MQISQWLTAQSPWPLSATKQSLHSPLLSNSKYCLGKYVRPLHFAHFASRSKSMPDTGISIACWASITLLFMVKNCSSVKLANVWSSVWVSSRISIASSCGSDSSSSVLSPSSSPLYSSDKLLSSQYSSCFLAILRFQSPSFSSSSSLSSLSSRVDHWKLESNNYLCILLDFGIKTLSKNDAQLSTRFWYFCSKSFLSTFRLTDKLSKSGKVWLAMTWNFKKRKSSFWFDRLMTCCDFPRSFRVNIGFRDHLIKIL